MFSRDPMGGAWVGNTASVKSTEQVALLHSKQLINHGDHCCHIQPTGWAKKTKPHTFVHIFAKY